MVTLLGCGLEWCFFFECLGMVPIWFRLRLTSIRKLKKRMRMTPNTVMKFEDLKEHGRESAVKVMKFEDLKEDGSESAVKVEELLKEYDCLHTSSPNADIIRSQPKANELKEHV